MKKIISIEIEGVKHPIKYGYGAYKLLARKWGVDRISGLAKHFGKLGFKKGVEPTFDQYDVLGEIGLAGVLFANDKCEDVTADDVVQFLFHNPKVLEDIMTEFMASFPKQEDGKTPGKQPGVQKK